MIKDNVVHWKINNFQIVYHDDIWMLYMIGYYGYTLIKETYLDKKDLLKRRTKNDVTWFVP